ncbi:MBL fold metallo-hydrolase [Leifsonia bigeumensis]|uniref:MBL fold metallo-hydrolase n=1 Tax=Leifsonella bigeumensis TaxID=433643 RepID=A0ABP7FBL2_9MICO
MSTAQFEAAAGDGIPPLEQVREGLYCYGVPLPGVLPHFTLSYLVLDDAGGVHIIDPGWDSDENWHALEAVLAGLGRGIRDVATVTVTHLHPDHLGMAERVRQASGAVVALHRAEQDAIRELTSPADDPLSADAAAVDRFAGWGVPADRHPELLDAVHRRGAWDPFTADRLLDDGDLLDIPGLELRALHTPGHTTGHLAILDAERQLVFTGDLLLPNQFPGIGLGGTPDVNPIEAYLRSLSLVASFDDHEALPGHGYRFTGIAERCAETAAHHDRRTREVSAALAATDAGAGTVWSVASGLTWTAGWENLHGFALHSALSQTALHIGRAQNSAP